MGKTHKGGAPMIQWECLELKKKKSTSREEMKNKNLMVADLKNQRKFSSDSAENGSQWLGY